MLYIFSIQATELQQGEEVGAIVGSDRRRRGLRELTAERERSKVAEDEAVCSPATTSQEASAHFCDGRGRGGSRSLGLTAFAAVVVGAAAAVTPFRGCGWVPVKQRIAALCRDLRGDSASHAMLTCRTLGRHG
ncbi:hypothetical protein GW17_00055292 [Ensete ventricosum]|nr:hypothetical protein GW17_00055292 [Ensete ventricosum]